MSEPVATAFVGTGWWGRELAKAASRTGGALKIVRGCGLDEDERVSFGREFGCEVTAEFTDILVDPAVEAIVLATPHLMHRDQIVAAASAGKHILVEKPLATTFGDAWAAVEAARSGKVILAVGHNRGLLSQVDMLKQAIENGELGRVLHVEANFSTAEALALPPGHWRTSPDQCPGGAMTVLGVHVIDWFHRLFGEVATVSAQFSHRGTSVSMEDVAVAWLTFSSGLTGSLTCLYSAPYTNRFIVFGTEANASVVGTKPDTAIDRPQFSLARNGQEAVEDRVIPFVDTLALQLRRFAHAVRGDDVAAVSGEEAARNVAVLDAIVRSARSGGRPEVVGYGSLSL